MREKLSRWTAEHRRLGEADGGARVLFACGELSCVNEAKPSAAQLQAAGVLTKLVYGPGSHQPYGPVLEVTRAANWQFVR